MIISLLPPALPSRPRFDSHEGASGSRAQWLQGSSNHTSAVTAAPPTRACQYWPLLRLYVSCASDCGSVWSIFAPPFCLRPSCNDCGNVWKRHTMSCNYKCVADQFATEHARSLADWYVHSLSDFLTIWPNLAPFFFSFLSPFTFPIAATYQPATPFYCKRVNSSSSVKWSENVSSMATRLGVGTAACGCRGLRSCLLCEQQPGATSLLQEEASHAIHQCYRCGRVLPEVGGKVQPDPTAPPLFTCVVPCSSSKVLRAWYGQEDSDDGGPIRFEGVTVIKDFISAEEESAIVETVDGWKWAESQSGRRKQVSL